MNASDQYVERSLTDLFIRINGVGGLHADKRTAALEDIAGEMNRLKRGDDGALSESVNLPAASAATAAYEAALQAANSALDALYASTVANPPAPPTPVDPLTGQ